jgi:tetratricopeptide (TPR) repeat protein
MNSGNHSDAAALANRILDLAQREGSPTSLAMAHRAQLQIDYYRGALDRVEQHFAGLRGLREAADFGRFPGVLVSGAGFASHALWIRGHADLARERVAQAIALARESPNPFALAVGGFFESSLCVLMRKPERTAAAATQALSIGEERGFPFLRDLALTSLGWARAQSGSAGEGVRQIRQGIAGLAEAGARLGMTEYLSRLAEAQAIDGKTENALVTIEEAVLANPDELVYRPEALRIRGELRLEQGHTEMAEADFRDAISLAVKMNAKAWELRATMSLARLLANQDRRDEARTMLTAIYGWFTEGFDTADLKDAKALLEELGA